MSPPIRLVPGGSERRGQRNFEIDTLPRRRVPNANDLCSSSVILEQAISAGLSTAEPQWRIHFISHAAHHAYLSPRLYARGINFLGVDSPPVALRKDQKSSTAQDGLPETATKRRKSPFAGLATTPVHNACTPFGEEKGENGEEGEERSRRRSANNSGWGEEMEAVHRHAILEHVAAIMESRNGGQRVTIVINLFALEGFHVAEKFGMRCVVAAPYVVPYRAPGGYERRFRAAHPQLYAMLQEADTGQVRWRDVDHWMWPLFTERWQEWRMDTLGLPAFPMEVRNDELAGSGGRRFSAHSAPLPVRACHLNVTLQYYPLSTTYPTANLEDKIDVCRYGFSPNVVECPGYWPESICVCGFWFLPPDWDTLLKCRQPPSQPSLIPTPGQPHPHVTSTSLPAATPAISENASNKEGGNGGEGGGGEGVGEGGGGGGGGGEQLPGGGFRASQGVEGFLREGGEVVMVGFSSIGSMGLLTNPSTLIQTIHSAIETIECRAIILTAGFPPLLQAALSTGLCLSPPYLHPTVRGDAGGEGVGEEEERMEGSGGGWLLKGGRILMVAGSVPHSWLLPRCQVAMHHGGSGTSAAAIRSGVPQVICPFLLDQFYWAARLEYVGVAAPALKPEDLMPGGGPGEVDRSVKNVVCALRKALRSDMKKRAEELAMEVSKEEDGVVVAVKKLIGNLKES